MMRDLCGQRDFSPVSRDATMAMTKTLMFAYDNGVEESAVGAQ